LPSLVIKNRQHPGVEFLNLLNPLHEMFKMACAFMYVREKTFLETLKRLGSTIFILKFREEKAQLPGVGHLQVTELTILDATGNHHIKAGVIQSHDARGGRGKLHELFKREQTRWSESALHLGK